VRRPWRAGLIGQSGRFGLLLIAVAIFVVFSLLAPDSFPTIDNVRTIAGANSVVLVLALGSLLPLVVGEFDLSVGAMLGLASALIASLTGATAGTLTLHLDTPLAMVLVVIAGVVVGLINGALIVGFRLSSFIATLGTATVLTGVVLLLTTGTSLYIGVPPSVYAIGQGDWSGIPHVTVYAIGTVIAIWYVLDHTPFGRRLYAIGGSPESAVLLGIKVGRSRILAFAVSGGLAASAGILEFGRIGAAHPSIGPQFLLPALAAGFLGATTIRPGWFNPIGTAVAVMFIAVGVAGLEQLGAPYWVEPLFNGVALIVAVVISQPLMRQQRR
jgi:ribose transport system permease protein